MAFEQFSNNEDEENQNKDPGIAPTNAGNQSAQIGMGTSTPQANRQGSGRFTNMQKYVQANKQGAENLAQRVGTGIQNQLSSTEKDVTKSTQDVSTNVGSGREKLTTAGQSESELAGIGEGFKGGFGSILSDDRGAFGTAQKNLQGFTQNPNYQNFMNVKAGEGVNEQELAALQNKATQGASAFQDLFKQRQGQVGNVEGRKAALSEFIGGKGQAVRPAYSSGQSRLDQLVMGQNAPALQGLINKVGANQVNVQTALGNVAKTGTDVSTLTADEQNLINKITGTSTGAQQAFESAFNQDKINELNTARANKFAEASGALKSGSVSQDLYSRLADANRLGVDNTLFNLMDNSDLGTQDRLQNDYLQRISDAQAAADIVGKGDVSTNALLAGITGQGPKFTKEGNTSTQVDWRMADGGTSNFANAMMGEQQRQTQLAKDTQLGRVDTGKGAFSYEQSAYDALRGAGKDVFGGTAGISDYAGKNVDTNFAVGNLGNDVESAMATRSNMAAEAARREGEANYKNYLQQLSGTASTKPIDINDPVYKSYVNAADQAARESVGGRYNQLKDFMSQQGYGKKLRIV